MKKILILVSVIALALTLSSNVSAATATDLTVDQILHLKADEANDDVYGWSGLLVHFGTSDATNDYKYAYKVAKGNDIRVDEFDADADGEVDTLPAAKWGSFGKIYFNNSDSDMTVNRVLIDGYMILTVDGNGNAVRFEDGYRTHDLGQCYDEFGAIVDRNADLSNCRQVTGNARAIDASGNLLFINDAGNDTTDSTEVIESETVDTTPKYKKDGDVKLTGEVWENADGDKIAIHSDDYAQFLIANPGYTTKVLDVIVKQAMVTNDGTTPSYEYLDWLTLPTTDIIVPAGGFVIEFEYLDRLYFTSDDAAANKVAAIQTLFNEVEDFAKIEYTYEHKVGPAIVGADDIEVPLGGEFTLPTVTADPVQYDYNTDQLATVELVCTIDGVACDSATVDTSILGNSYEIRYVATDSLGLVKEATNRISIIDALSPVISGVGEMMVDEGANLETALMENVTADDGYGNDITADVKVLHGIADVRKAAPGYYTVTYLVYNDKGKSAFETAIVTVNDVTSPVVLTQDLVITEGEELDLESGILFITDNVDKEFDLVLNDNGGFDKDVAGEYTIIYDVYDAVGGNKTTSTFKVTVNALPEPAPKTQPKVFVEDVTITAGDDLVLEDAAKFFVHEEDTDFTVAVKDNGGFDKDVAGEYDVTLEVSSANSKSIDVTYKVVVLEAEKTLTPTIAIAGLIVAIVAAGMGGISIFKKF